TSRPHSSLTIEARYRLAPPDDRDSNRQWKALKAGNSGFSRCKQRKRAEREALLPPAAPMKGRFVRIYRRTICFLFAGTKALPERLLHPFFSKGRARPQGRDPFERMGARGSATLAPTRYLPQIFTSRIFTSRSGRAGRT